MNGLNILPSYTDYFTLTTTTLALNTASVWMGSAIAGIGYAKVPDWIGRKWSLFIGAVLTIIGVIIQAAAQNIAMFVIARIIVSFCSCQVLVKTSLSAIVLNVWLNSFVNLLGTIDRLRDRRLFDRGASVLIGDSASQAPGRLIGSAV